MNNKIVWVAGLVFALLSVGVAQAGDRGERALAMLKQADANNDGVVSVAEVQAKMLARSTGIDVNKDGAISSTELGVVRASTTDARTTPRCPLRRAGPRQKRHGLGGGVQCQAQRAHRADGSQWRWSARQK